MSRSWLLRLIDCVVRRDGDCCWVSGKVSGVSEAQSLFLNSRVVEDSLVRFGGTNQPTDHYD